MLCCLFLLDGDFTISLRSGTPVYAGVYLIFYFAAVLLYFWLQRSDPGFLASEEHSTLLEDGELRRRSKDRLGPLHGCRCGSFLLICVHEQQVTAVELTKPHFAQRFFAWD